MGHLIKLLTKKNHRELPCVPGFSGSDLGSAYAPRERRASVENKLRVLQLYKSRKRFHPTALGIGVSARRKLSVPTSNPDAAIPDGTSL